jgi:hypothetical protein
MNYTVMFWVGTLVFLATSLILAWQNWKQLDGLFVAQILGGLAIFVGSKIGRSFLGLE